MIIILSIVIRKTNCYQVGKQQIGKAYLIIKACHVEGNFTVQMDI